MAVVVREGMPSRHPWLEAFLADPDTEIADFLAGYARVEPYGRAETPDAARMLFGPLAPGDPARRMLDQALGKWLDERRQEGMPDEEGGRLDRKLREIADAIRIVSLLALPQTAADFRHRYLLWNSWLERLDPSAGPDIRAAFFSTLALMQRRMPKAAAGTNPLALESLWLKICEQAGSSYPVEYLSIGLLGLRLLPERRDMPSERPWMTGLARWAAAQRPGVQDFVAQWIPLKTLYQVTTPGHWRSALADTLRQKATESIRSDVRDYWENDVGLGKLEPHEGSRRTGRGAAVSPAPYHVFTALLDRLDGPLRGFSSELHNLILQNERYAEATGDSWNLVRSANRLGMQLIKTGPRDEWKERGSEAVALARKALSWESTNVLSWVLWRNALESQGLYEAAELVGWEAIRRFPEDAFLRTQLARLLVNLSNREDDAESLLRETRERFPRDPFPATQLSYLLKQRPDADSQDEARRLLREVLEVLPGDIVTSSQLAYLLAKSRVPKDQEEAETLLRNVLDHEPGDVVASSQLAYLLAKKRDPQDYELAEAERLLRDVLKHDPDDIVAIGQLAYVLAKSPDRAAEAEELLRDVLKHQPDDHIALVQLVAILTKRPEPSAQEEAKTLLRGALRRIPGDPVASRQLAYLLDKRPEPGDEAERVLREALRFNPDDAMSIGQLAYVLLKRSDRAALDEAEDLLLDLRRREPDNIVWSGHLAYVVAKRKERDEAASTARADEVSRNGGIVPATETQPQGEQPHGEQEHGEQPRDLQNEMDRMLEETIKGSFDALITQSVAAPPSPAAEEPSAESLASELAESPAAASADSQSSSVAQPSQPAEAIAAAEDPTPALKEAAEEPAPAPKDVAKEPAPASKDAAKEPAPALKEAAKERAPASKDKKTNDQSDPDMTIAAVRRGGRLRRLATVLRRREDDPELRRSAEAEIQRILNEDENFAYAQYVRNKLGESEDGAFSGAFAIAFYNAMRRKDPARFDELQSSHASQSEMFDAARAFLFKDRAAADRVVNWLKDPPTGESRSVAALRALFEQRFGEKISANKYRFEITDADVFLDLVAANDNIEGDLIESALASIAA